MNREQFEAFSQAAVWICAAGALLNLALYRRRGVSSLALAGAFLAFGGTILLVRFSFPSVAVVLGGLVVAVLLATDVWLRAGTKGPGKDR